MKLRGTFAVLTVWVLLVNASMLHAAGSLRWLEGFTGGAGLTSNTARVSGDGKVVVAKGPNGMRRWSAQTGYIEVDSLPGYDSSFPNAVSADGSVIVGRSHSGGPAAFRWTVGGGTQLLPPLPGGVDMAAAYGISDDGSIIVGSDGTDHFGMAAVWDGDDHYTIGALSSTQPYSRANAVSGDGTIIVGHTEVREDGGVDRGAFRWTDAGGMVPLVNLVGGYHRAEAFDISADGSVIVGSSRSDAGVDHWGGGPVEEAFRWTEAGGMVGLGDLPGGGFRSSASATSADGSVIVGMSETDVVVIPPMGDWRHVSSPFIWTEQAGMRSVLQIVEDDLGLDTTGMTFGMVTDVSADGTIIVGTGIAADGGSHVWVLNTVPEPSTLALAAWACAALLARRRTTRARRHTIKQRNR